MNLNLGLTKDDFDRLVQELKKGNEYLFEIIFKELVQNAIKKLKQKNEKDDIIIEDTVMETLLIFRKRIIEDKVKYGAINFLFYKILSQEYYRIKNKENKYVYLNTNDTTYRDDSVYEKEQFNLLKKAIKKLDKTCQEVIKRLYTYNNSTNEISQHLNISESGIRKRKIRCLDKLKIILLKNEDFI